MMRATPYCSVSPMAMSAYMPPSIRPVRMALVMTGPAASGMSLRYGATHAGFGTIAVRAPSLRPGRCRRTRRPATGRPTRARRHVVLELDLADHGIERAGLQVLDDGGAVDLADALDRLLQHLQAGVGDRAGPAIRLGAVGGGALWRASSP